MYSEFSLWVQAGTPIGVGQARRRSLLMAEHFIKLYYTAIYGQGHLHSLPCEEKL